MARTEKRLPMYTENTGRFTVDRVPDYKASHPRACWTCGKGSKARRIQRSKPRRREAKQIIAQGEEYWGEPVY